MSTKLTDLVGRWLNFIQFCLLPGVCILCRRNTGQRLDLCQSCLDQLKPVVLPCLGCGLPLPESEHAGVLCGACLGGHRPVSRSVMRFAWSEPASGLISQFKYQRQLQFGNVLTTLLSEQLQLSYAGQPLPEVLVPVPLHPRKLRSRGYNQSLLIARLLGKVLGIPVNTALVQRSRDTPAQQGLSARARRRNLRGAFILHPTASLTAIKSLALVDDVVTTMSTANALAQLLRDQLAEPPEIHLWALARA